MPNEVENNEVENNEVDNTNNKVENTTTPPPVVSEAPITKKDPKKVEQGKRLAAISREAKERKLREKIEAEYNDKYNKPNYSSYVIPIASAFGVFSFFYMWSSMQHQYKTQTPPSSNPPNLEQNEKAKPTPKFETFE